MYVKNIEADSRIDLHVYIGRGDSEKLPTNDVHGDAPQMINDLWRYFFCADKKSVYLNKPGEIYLVVRFRTKNFSTMEAR